MGLWAHAAPQPQPASLREAGSHRTCDFSLERTVSGVFLDNMDGDAMWSSPGLPAVTPSPASVIRSEDALSWGGLGWRGERTRIRSVFSRPTSF